MTDQFGLVNRDSAQLKVFTVYFRRRRMDSEASNGRSPFCFAGDGVGVLQSTAICVANTSAAYCSKQMAVWSK